MKLTREIVELELELERLTGSRIAPLTEPERKGKVAYVDALGQAVQTARIEAEGEPIPSPYVQKLSDVMCDWR